MRSSFKPYIYTNPNYESNARQQDILLVQQERSRVIPSGKWCTLFSLRKYDINCPAPSSLGITNEVTVNGIEISRWALKQEAQQMYRAGNMCSITALFGANRRAPPTFFYNHTS